MSATPLSIERICNLYLHPTQAAEAEVRAMAREIEFSRRTGLKIADHYSTAQEAITVGEAAFMASPIPSWAAPGIEFARAQALAMLALVDAMRDLSRHQADANGIALAGLGPDARITFLSRQEDNRG